MFSRAVRHQLLPLSHRLAAARSFSSTASRMADFTHVAIGGGVIGLATARHLALTQTNSSTLLLERHSQIGTESSSRNSEVIHAGLYYGADSLKTKLCIRGKNLMYDFCARYHVPHSNSGKWVVAQDEEQRAALEELHRVCRDELGVPTRWLSSEEARRLEPDVRCVEGVLESTTTGIVDSHALMSALQGGFEEAGGETALNSTVVAVEPTGVSGLPGSGGWRITVKDSETGEQSIIEAETLVNCAGLGAVDVHNMIVPQERRMKMYYAKGNYFSYAASKPKVSRLIYPVTMPGAGGLGTHLTLDMAGRMRFGPDVEWVDDPTDLRVNGDRLPPALVEIKKYLPGVDETALAADYAGIRAKLGKAGAVASGKGFLDFYIKKEDGFEGWVNLLGMESPGLTSSLAIGEMVGGLIYGERNKKAEEL
ncbi:FAD dependent oxidoreductase [Pseudomassariella vexata]|uniref:L-2-hydroxyglutarate dehydrogenase, mitochondrial n=1 Tax=Pseudomassariella vexata TaxID=1141098 RepID=A0A1Y2DWE4_9PEZI|nr:FAD dependent oxidoreductase [Pseudomassariella vexata]ORY62945.1 FAD dependent oxidoreductase [Pseudomassariella vexata]